MKSKEQVINGILCEYNNVVKNWLKTRINGAWDNGYLHGRDDAFRDFFATEAEQKEEASE